MKQARWMLMVLAALLLSLGEAAFDFVDSRDPSYRKGVLTFKK